MTSPPPEHTYRFGGYTLEPREQRLRRDGAQIHLSGKAHELLVVLVSRAGQVVTRDELLSTLWPDAAVEDSNITVHISALRRALSDLEGAIETVPRLGYRFTTPVTTLDAPVAAPPAVPTPAVAVPTTATRHRWPQMLAGTAVIVALASWWLMRPTLESFTVVVMPQENLPLAACCNAVFLHNDDQILISGGAAHSQSPSDRANPWTYDSRYWIQDLRLRFANQRGEHTDERDAPAHTRLPDGRHLFTGGYGCVTGDRLSCRFISTERVPLSTAVIYDPVTNEATPVVGGMHQPRAGHTATLLHDGTVLLVGGYHGPPGSDDWGTAVELFDPAAPPGTQFRLLEPLSPALVRDLACDTCAGDVRKADHTATLLPDGSVLIAGGWRGTATAGIFDGALRYRPGDPGLTPASPSGRPFVRAASATATLLGDGRVLFVGGTRDFSLAGSREHVLAATTVYDPATDRQIAGPTMSVPRVGHSATPISPHSVVVIGGMRCDVSVEQVRAKGPHDPTRAPCDSSASGDIITINGRRSQVTSFPMVSGHAYHASVVLPDGRIYIPGGLMRTGMPTTSTVTVALTPR